MNESRREFLVAAGLGVLGTAAGRKKKTEGSPAGGEPLPPGAPSAFATSPAVGPEVSAGTFGEAQKLMRVELSAEQQAQAASTTHLQQSTSSAQPHALSASTPSADTQVP